MDRVYIETTVVSYLTARPHRDIVIAGHQQSTHDFWDFHRAKYELCTSALVIREASAGDPQAAQERLDALKAMIVLDAQREANELAVELVRAGALPPKALDDALHIAIAAEQRIPYLLTWNLRHMLNATMRPLILTVCDDNRFKAPIICTPEELVCWTNP